MAADNKAVDLGKLQTAQYNAEALVKSARRVLDGAYTKYDNAAQALENAKAKHKSSLEELDKAKRAVIEGARAIANS